MTRITGILTLWLAVRASYRADMRSNNSNVLTEGMWFAPLDVVHIDLNGGVGEDKTRGDRCTTHSRILIHPMTKRRFI